jgi:hypothetical protein
MLQTMEREHPERQNALNPSTQENTESEIK